MSQNEIQNPNASNLIPKKTETNGNEQKDKNKHSILKNDLESLFNQLKTENIKLLNESFKDALNSNNEEPVNPFGKVKPKNEKEDIANVLFSINEKNKRSEKKPIDTDIDFSLFKNETIIVDQDQEPDNELQNTDAKVIDDLYSSITKFTKKSNRLSLLGNQKRNDDQFEEKILDYPKKKSASNTLLFDGKVNNCNQMISTKPKEVDPKLQKVYVNTNTTKGEKRETSGLNTPSLPIEKLKINEEDLKDKKEPQNGIFSIFNNSINADHEEKSQISIKNTDIHKFEEKMNKNNMINNKKYTNLNTPVSKTPNVDEIRQNSTQIVPQENASTAEKPKILRTYTNMRTPASKTPNVDEIRQNNIQLIPQVNESTSEKPIIPPKTYTNKETKRGNINEIYDNETQNCRQSIKEVEVHDKKTETNNPDNVGGNPTIGLNDIKIETNNPENVSGNTTKGINDQKIEPSINKKESNADIVILPKRDIIANSSFRLMKSKNVSEQETEVIKDLKPNYTPEIPYTVFLLSQTNKNMDICNKDFLSKRNAIMGNNYFLSIITGSKNQIKIEYNYQKKLMENYEQIKNQYNFIYQDISIEEKNSLQKLLLNSPTQIKSNEVEITQPCYLYDQKTFAEMFHYQHDITSITFDYYRIFESDGDSFFRSFMFSYVECLLINKKKNELLAMFVDIFRLTDCKEFAYKLINLREAMIFFSILSDLVQSGQHLEAYNLFILAYINPATKETVDDLLVLYMKWCIFAMQYDDMYHLLDKKEIEEKNKKSSNRDSFENNNILKPRMEPSRIVFESIPFVFNVNLKIHWIEGDTQNSIFELCEFSDKNKAFTIHLGYFYSGYNCVYLNDLYEKNKLFTKVKATYMLEAPSCKINESKKACSTCKQLGKIVFFESLNKSICYECLMRCVDLILIQRAQNYVQDAFFNLEYYSNTLYLNNKSISINNCDLIVISNQTIQQKMANIIETMCYCCFNQIDPLELIQLHCSCRFCRNCLTFKLKEATNNLIILNRFELETNKKYYCLCKEHLNIKEVLALLNEPFEDETANAKKRMTQLTSTLCSNCCNTLIHEDKSLIVENKLTKKQYIKYKIIKQDNNDLIAELDYTDLDHLICNYCVNKLKAERIKENKVEKILHCKICYLDHKIDPLKKENISCIQQCLIY